jgi:hypothetical protein
LNLTKVRTMKRIVLFAAAAACAGLVFAKLPPLSDEAKAKAAEAAAKAAHGSKVEGFQLCKSMNRTAAVYFAEAKKANKEVKAPTATPDCVDPVGFVYPPPAAGTAPAAPAPAPAAAPAPAGKPPAKKT